MDHPHFSDVGTFADVPSRKRVYAYVFERRSEWAPEEIKQIFAANDALIVSLLIFHVLCSGIRLKRWADMNHQG